MHEAGLHVGSTGCIATVDFSKREVIAANVGDSRAMLIRDGKALRLTEESARALTQTQIQRPKA